MAGKRGRGARRSRGRGGRRGGASGGRARSRSRSPGRVRGRSQSPGVSGRRSRSRSSNTVRATSALGQAVGASLTGFSRRVAAVDSMDYVVPGGWVAVPAKLGAGFQKVVLDKMTAYQTIKGEMATRLVAALVEFDHFGMADFRGRVRVICTPGDSVPADAKELAGQTSHKFVDLNKLPKGMWQVVAFQPLDFPRVWDDSSDGNLPALAMSWEIAGRPSTATDTSAGFSFQFCFLFRTRKKAH